MRPDIDSHPLTWHPQKAGKRGPIVFHDDITRSLGLDPTGARLQKLKDRILSGNYYPQNIIKFTPIQTPLQVGTRIHQAAPIIPGLPWPVATGITEIFVADQTPNSIHIGYVTTARHHARGIWQAHITRNPQTTELNIHIWDTIYPHSFLYWIGIPYARFLQQRALYGAIADFKKING